MKRAKGLVFFVIALLIVGLACTAFFGVYTWYGAREDTIIRGTKSLLTGVGLGKTAQVVFTPDESAEVNAEKLEEAQGILLSRLATSGYESAQVDIDYTNNKIVITLPLSENYKAFAVKSILDSSVGKGVLTIREGDEKDENGLPSGNTANVLLDNKDISAAYSGKTGSGLPGVELFLTNEGSTALTSATYQLSGGALSIWMDNEELVSYGIDQAITNGRITISNNSMTAEDAERLSYKINFGPMPFGFTYENIIELSSAESNSLQNILLAVGCAFAVLCILLIVFYRLTGVIISLALILESAISVILFTGYFPVFEPKVLTIPGILGMALLGLTTVALGVWQAERIKANFNNKVVFDASIKGGLKGISAASVDAFIVAGITAFMALAAFGTSNYRLAWFQNLLAWLGVNAGSYTVYPFPFALLYGIILNALVVLLIQRVMTYSLASMSAFKKPFLFGGKKDVIL